jgi:hypothetical protein
MDRDLTLREALQEHLAAEGFPPDGGNSEPWVTARLGPLVFCLPNWEVRRRATLPHDLNHVISGYGHDLIGEAEVSAWELGGGCGRYVAAWFFPRAALIPGVAIATKRMFLAFVRGRRTGNLFTRDFEQLLDRPLQDVRMSLGLDRTYDWHWHDVGAFIRLLLGAPLAGATLFAISVLTSPAWIAAHAYRQRRQTTAGGPSR